MIEEEKKKKKCLLDKLKESISLKLSIPILIVIFLVIFANLIQKNSALNDKEYDLAVAHADKIVKLMQNEMNASAEKSLISASVFANLPSVVWAYTLQLKINNIDSTSSMIDRSVKPLINNIKKVSGVLPKVHFHLPPAKSFYRSWTNKKGDDLSSYRPVILRISSSHNPLKGVEVGKSGILVRGISPIYNSNQTYLGSVEVHYSINNILNNIVNLETEDYALYIKKEKLKTATILDRNISNTEKRNVKTGDFVLYESSNNYSNDNLSIEDFNFIENKVIYKLSGNYMYVQSPILNFNDEIIGLSSIQIDLSESIHENNLILIKFLIFGSVVLILISLLFIYLIKRFVSKPIKQLSKNITQIATGKLINRIEIRSLDEVGIIYQAFNSLLDRLKLSTKFANEIGEGHLDVSIDNINDDDVLSLSLMKMRDNLKEAKEVEKERKKEEDKRNWATVGLAKFADLLRKNSNDISKLSDIIIRNLVEYLQANQGGLFILNDNDSSETYLELLSAVAFDRKKFLEKSIKLGEGLVGTCALEKESIYLTEVPKEYVNITSGLGDATPRSILIVPLKIEDEVFGIVEIASFKEIEDYQIEFVEILGESIASTLSTVKINQRTSELLEQSQQQSEELSAQEEEMRQNLEEMQATQDESSRREEELERIIRKLKGETE